MVGKDWMPFEKAWGMGWKDGWMGRKGFVLVGIAGLPGGQGEATVRKDLLMFGLVLALFLGEFVPVGHGLLMVGKGFVMVWKDFVIVGRQ